MILLFLNEEQHTFIHKREKKEKRKLMIAKVARMSK
jgi:hypothetical protein